MKRAYLCTQSSGSIWCGQKNV